MKARITQSVPHKDHQIYEIWNEYAAESIYYVGNKPTNEELIEVVTKEWGYTDPIENYIKDWIHVEPLKHVYASRSGWCQLFQS